MTLLRTTQLPALAALLFAAVACMPEDTPVQPFDRGDAQSALVSMGTDYADRIYFDLSSNMAVSAIDFTAWDLEFACEADSYEIRANSAQFVSVANLGAVDLASVDAKAAEEAEFKFDVYSGDSDSLAIGQWWSAGDGALPLSRGNVYVAELGYDAAGKTQGSYKFVIESADESGYSITYADMKGGEAKSARIERDDRFNFVGFEFSSGETILHEPPRGTWDFVFTKYTYIFFLPERLPYSVTGVLTNPNGAGAILETETPYEDIDRALATTLVFGTREDVVGYEWKTFDFSGSNFQIDPTRSYILRDTDGFLYKLRFTDFYDPVSGDKGTPQFEFQLL